MIKIVQFTTAAAVVWCFRLALVGIFIGIAYEQTNGFALGSSAVESSRDSHDYWKSNIVQVAELDTVIKELMGRQRHRVKLHDPLRSAIRRWDEHTNYQRVCSCSSERQAN